MKNVILPVAALSFACFALTANAKCVNGRELVHGYTKSNGTHVNSYYRTCADGNKNNNFGKQQYPGQNPYTRDADHDGIPNYLDRDDNNNGLTDNQDAALDKIFRANDLTKVIVPQLRSYRRYGDYPVYKGDRVTVIIYGDRYARPTGSRFVWKENVYGNATCEEETPGGLEIGQASNDDCMNYVGMEYLWKEDVYGNAECRETSPDGLKIAVVDKNNCRAYQGRYFDWKENVYGNAECQELTPDGLKIGVVSPDDCRQTVGSKAEWKENVYGQAECQELSPDDLKIAVVDKNICRYGADAAGNITVDRNGGVLVYRGAPKSGPAYGERLPGVAEQGYSFSAQ
jgi:hypothetical protein